MKPDLECEGENKADQGESLGESAEDKGVGEQLAGQFGLASRTHAQTVTAQTEADARAKRADAVANDLQGCDNECSFHFSSFCRFRAFPGNTITYVHPAEHAG